jgi:hypothetical protein
MIASDHYLEPMGLMLKPVQEGLHLHANSF